MKDCKLDLRLRYFIILGLDLTYEKTFLILPRNRSREIGYDPKKQGEGEYCLYNSYGAASTVVEIDCLTGEHQVSCDVKWGEKNR